MRALVQRVVEASVSIDEKLYSSIGPGLLVLLGIAAEDTTQDLQWLAGKVAALRVFNDPSGVMNLDVRQSGGEVMVVSQFTLMAKTNRGNRPSYINAAAGESAIELYRQFAELTGELIGRDIATGVFGADMKLGLINDGPVTIWIDSRQRD